MLEYLKDIFLSPMAAILTSIIGFAGFILTIVFYYKSKKLKLPVYMSTNNNIIGTRQSSNDNLEIRFKGKQVNNLNLTTVSFWNAGDEPIRHSDIASTDPIRITVDDSAEILDFSIENHKPSNRFEVKIIDNKTLELSFEYLDFNDGIVISFYHNSEVKYPKVHLNGTIIGSKIRHFEEVFNRIQNSTSWFTDLLEKLSNHKNLLYKVIGFLLAVLSFFILVPLQLLIAPFIWYKKRYNLPPKEFILGYL